MGIQFISRLLCSVVIALLISLLVSSPPARASEQVVVGLDDWPPFSGPQVEGRGISERIIEAALAEVDMTPEFLYLPWARVEKSLQDGSVHMIGNLYDIPEIQEWAEYSEPYYSSAVRFLAGKNFSATVRGLEDLKPFSIGVGLGYSFGEEFDKAAYLDKQNIPLTANGIAMIARGRLDIVIDSAEVIEFLLQTSEQKHAEEMKFLDYVLSVNTMSAAISRAHPENKGVLRRFNAGLAAIKENGIYEQVMSQVRGKWLKPDS